MCQVIHTCFKRFSHMRRTSFHDYMSIHYLTPKSNEEQVFIKTSVDVNIIIVDWENYSSQWNYVNAVNSLPIVRNDTLRLLKTMMDGFKDVEHKLDYDGLWNNLYFIGHSLGAHLSGQIAYFLKDFNFFKIERITALDPAQPCFLDGSLSMRLDEDDADFVDVIHTHNGMGLKDPIGHVDFYVNGGEMQSKCELSNVQIELNKKICSHILATAYYVESINDLGFESCKFIGHRWDHTYKDAKNIINNITNHSNCSNCAIMGFRATKEKGTGSFLVLTSTESPYCYFKESDMPYVDKCLGRLNVTTEENNPGSGESFSFRSYFKNI